MSQGATARMPTQSGWRIVDVVLLLAGIFALWQAVYLFAGEIAISSPVATVGHLGELLSLDWFRPHLLTTLKAFSLSLVIAAAGGIVLGLALGFHRLSSEVAEPILNALYSVPKITLYPLILLVFGLGMEAKVAFGVIHGLIPITIFTMNAVRNINQSYLRTARVMRLSTMQTATTILIPAVLPEIITGLRVGFALTLLGVVIGEMFASQHGLGFLIIRGVNNHDVPTMTAVVLLLVVFSAVSNIIMLTVEKAFHKGAQER